MDPCKSHSEHQNHLCKLTADGLHRENPEEYMGLVKDPKYVCKSCGRVAAVKSRLCTPVMLGTWEE